MPETLNEPESAITRRPVAWSLVILTGLMAGLIRFVPYEYRWANFAPIGALCLFSGARIGGWAGFVWPLGVMLISDFLLNQMYGWISFDPYVFGSYVLLIGVGTWANGSVSPIKIGSLAIVNSTLFFLITNFGAWRQLIGRPYSNDFQGLADCYLAGLPFARPTIVSDLLFTAVLFTAHYALARAFSPSEIPSAAGETA